MSNAGDSHYGGRSTIDGNLKAIYNQDPNITAQILKDSYDFTDLNKQVYTKNMSILDQNMKQMSHILNPPTMKYN